LDLRTRQGVFTYLIKKRNCYLSRIQDKIKRLQEKEAAVKIEIREYQAQLDLEIQATFEAEKLKDVPSQFRHIAKRT
ncbi:6920_t:CDS:2, partial [Ambispora leptoticha]